MATYAQYGSVQGRSGGPYLDELEVLEAEKKRAQADKREPEYAVVLLAELGIRQPVAADEEETGDSVFGN